MTVDEKRIINCPGQSQSCHGECAVTEMFGVEQLMRSSVGEEVRDVHVLGVGGCEQVRGRLGWHCPSSSDG